MTFSSSQGKQRGLTTSFLEGPVYTKRNETGRTNASDTEIKALGYGYELRIVE